MLGYCSCIQNRQLVNFESGVHARSRHKYTNDQWKQGQVHSPGLIRSVLSAGATVTAAQQTEGDECKCQMWRGGKKVGASRCHGYIERCRSRYYVGYNYTASLTPYPTRRPRPTPPFTALSHSRST